MGCFKEFSCSGAGRPQSDQTCQVLRNLTGLAYTEAEAALPCEQASHQQGSHRDPTHRHR